MNEQIKKEIGSLEIITSYTPDEAFLGETLTTKD